LAWALLPIYAFQIAIAPSANAFAVTLADTDALKFVKSASTITRISTASSVLTDMGKTAGDIVLYKSVGSFGGVTIDCAVTTVAVDGSVSNYDDPGSASTAAGYLNNFQINTVGGAVTFKFEFFQAGTYTGVNTGIPVILQNVKITSIDLDSSTNAGSYQYTDFTGFQKYSLMSPTNLGVTPMTNPNRVRFIATKTGARSSVPEDQVLVKYDSIQSIQMTFGNVVAGSTNYFGLVFGGWPGTGTPVESSNVYNTPPTSTSETLTVATGVATTIPLSAFGTYADVDNNPFYQVRIATLPGSGTLQYLNGSNWTNVSNGQVISVSDIQLGKLRFTGSSATSLTFSVHDGLDYSATTYTLNIAIAANAQAITFNNPGTKAPNNTPFASNATSNSGLTVILTSDTRGVCTVNGLDITPIATGICVITATQPGDGSYGAAAPVTQTFPVDSKTSQEITFNKPVDRTFSSTPFASGASSNSGLTVTLTSYTPSVCTVSGLNIVMVSTGICQIRATQDGNASVAPAVPVDQNFLITPGAPVVNTNPATAVGSGTGTLNGTINTFGLPTTSLGFCLATSNTVSAGALTCSETITVTGETTTVVVSKLSVKSGLTNGTTYYYQLVGTTSGGTSYGQVQSFTPVAASTIMATTVQIDASSSGSATLMGTVNAGGNAQTISFCWNSSNSIVGNPSINDINVNGILSNCTNVAASPSSDSTNSNVNVTANLSNLRSDTNYYYQVRISKGGGNYVYGKILLFRTSSSKATTISATKTSSSATLNASGQSGSSRSSASTRICYNSTGEVSSIGILQTNLTTPEIAGCLTGSPSSIRSSSSDQNYSANLSGLTPNKTYYYQAYVSRSSSNYSYGEIKTFTTDPVAPAVTTQPATGIAGSKAHLNGTVVANAASATNSFCWGTASNLSGCTTEAAPDPLTSSGNAQTSVTVVIEGLTAGTTYYYRAISTNGTGTTNGSILSFIAGSPLAITSSPSSVASTSAVLNGAIKSNNLDTTATFCIGTSPTTSAS
jgi:hypothetical protein